MNPINYADLKQLDLTRDCDDTVTLTVLPKKDFNEEQVMVYLGLTPDLKYIRGAKYRSTNWGRWSKGKVNGHTQYYVGAGCNHEHDCCGCVSAITMEIAEMHQNWIVTVDCANNF